MDKTFKVIEKINEKVKVYFPRTNVIQVLNYNKLIKEEKRKKLNKDKKLIYNKGLWDIENYYEVIRDKEYYKLYDIWKGMIRRCYEPSNNSYYNKVFVSDEWLLFSNFYKWARNYNESNFKMNNYLDKDIIRGSNIYSSQNCIFVPKEINNLFVNYKIAKGITISSDTIINTFKTYITHDKHYLGRYIKKEEAIAVYIIAKTNYIFSISKSSLLKNSITEKIFKYINSWEIYFEDEDMNLIEHYKRDIKFNLNKYELLKRFLESLEYRITF